MSKTLLSIREPPHSPWKKNADRRREKRKISVHPEKEGKNIAKFTMERILGKRSQHQEGESRIS